MPVEQALGERGVASCHRVDDRLVLPGRDRGVAPVAQDHHAVAQLGLWSVTPFVDLTDRTKVLTSATSQMLVLKGGALGDGTQYSWCSEWGLGDHYFGLFPNSGEGETYAGDYSYGGGWEFTMRWAKSRVAACGF